MIKIRFLTIAEMEVDEAVSWYQEQSEDESLAFLNEIDHAIQIVRAYPLIATEIEPDTGLTVCSDLRVYRLTSSPLNIRNK